jgi:hypothetical protein
VPFSHTEFNSYDYTEWSIKVALPSRKLVVWIFKNFYDRKYSYLFKIWPIFFIHRHIYWTRWTTFTTDNGYIAVTEISLNLLKPTGYVMHQQFNLLKPTGYVMHQQFNLLKPTGYVMHKQFKIQQLYALPTLYLCVLYLSENKQRLVPLIS